MNALSRTVTTDFDSFETSIPEILDQLKAEEVFADQSRILLKPNLVNDDPHPVTTHPQMLEAMVRYIRSCSDAEILIAEGCGDHHLDTFEVFRRLGYDRLASKHGITLVDLNEEELITLENSNCKIFPEIHLPKIAFESYIVSLPVLKAHSLSKITGALKNMMGFAPPAHYSGGCGTWKKAFFHNNLHQAVFELNRYVTPDLSILDASIGLADFHLGGPECSPRVAKLAGGYNPVEVDKQACRLLGIDETMVPHIRPRSG
ncbi:MAG: DUF362 domain-containing protein [Desulfobacteraceae bacterium]